MLSILLTIENLRLLSSNLLTEHLRIAAGFVSLCGTGFVSLSGFVSVKDMTAPRQRRLARRVTSGKGLKQKKRILRVAQKTQIRAALQEILESLPENFLDFFNMK